MELFRQIGEVLGSMKALMILEDDVQINRSQCSLLFDMFNLAFETLSEEIKLNLRLEEKNTKWKALHQPLKELYRVFKEAESYVKQCMDCSKDWWVKALHFHNNRDAVEFHAHNLLCYFAIVVEAIETAGEISGLDLDEMKKKRIMLSNKYDMTWNDPKLFLWKYGKQYLISQDILHRMCNVWKEDQWLLLEMIKEKKVSPSFTMSKQDQRLSDLLMKKMNGEQSLFHSSILTGAKDYHVRRRICVGMQIKEIHWLGESFILRHFFGEPSKINSEISFLLSLSHPNVVQYLCGFHDEEKKEYFLVMEVMSKDLKSHIKEVSSSKRRMPFSFPAAVDIMLQIARGMEYLHSKKIYHGDLNPSNVVIKPRNSSSDGYFHAKISGVGLKDVKTVPARVPPPNQNEVFTFIWHAPEVLTEQERPGSSGKYKYSEKADVYSFGMLCFELLTGKVPFEDGHLQGDKMSRNIKAGERPLFPFALPKYLANLTRRCWQTDPNLRPGFLSICRILRYVKKLIVMNPHLAEPEIPSIVQVDFCDIEAGFMKKFPSEASAAVTPVSLIPFQLFSYRIAEKEKLNGISRDKSWDSHSEVVIGSPMDEIDNVLEDSLSPAHDTQSLCLEIPEKRLSVLRRVNGITTDDQFLKTHDKRSVSVETPDLKVSRLRKANSLAAGRSSLVAQHARSVCTNIPAKKRPSPLKSETRPACTESSEKKVPDKKVPFLRKTSVRTTKDPEFYTEPNACSAGKAKGKVNVNGPSSLSSRGHNARISADKHYQSQPLPQKPNRSKHKQAGYSPGHSSF
ncbi:light-sensor Protein kinase-like [Chenopodium quinoa]|uniref:light-sensor Protein kinase-like n=1 Tax=Chenopodium quinoa TaxID=63459 RepID=UPI000B795496|nr:light-sensor Protein kinase-like [Chenopodium quinoa]